MKLTLDISLSAHLLANADDTLHSLTFLLSRAQQTLHATPLEARVCEEFYLRKTPDFPVAAIAAQADGVNVENKIWFCADPVHYVLQRDAFVLHDEVPLALEDAHAEALMAHLNQHFSEDGLVFARGNSGRWYVGFLEGLADFYPVSTALPCLVVGKNVQHFLPQGHAAKKWRSILNEIQMLLHEHPVNIARESKKQLVMNSIWLSGSGSLPRTFVTTVEMPSLIVADNPFYAGMAQQLGVEFLSLPTTPEFLYDQQHSHVRLALNEKKLQQRDSSWMTIISALLKTRKMEQLTLNLGVYDQTLTAKIVPLDLYKFWRQVKPLVTYFQH